MKKLTTTSLAWLAALGLVLAASAQEPPTGGEAADKLSGSYRLALPPDTAQKRIEDAIDSGTDDMPGLRRRVARKRLRAKNDLIRQIQIDFRGSDIVVVLDDDRYAAPADGKLVKVRLSDGEEVRVSHKLAGGRLVQRFVGDDGVRVDVFTPSDDGSRLRMNVVLTSDRLKGPIRYRLPYRAR
ncbi:MAG: hypothetical protein ACODAU_03190 [Myxococcota bacterium]